MSTNNFIEVKDHINIDHKAFAGYDNMRSLAHIADGQKISSRKILHTVMETVKNGTEIKVSNLGSRASDMTHYQHAEASLYDTIVVMARDFMGTNHAPLLQREGQFGNRQDYSASSPRYIFVKRHKNINLLFNDVDTNLLEYELYDNEKVEPKFFLPCLPLLLINGSEGIGNGYSEYILPRKLSDVKDAVLTYLNTGVSVDLNPSFQGFTGSIVKNGSQYLVSGVFKRIDKTTIEIRDLPPDASYQYEKYKTRVLIPLLESGAISSFEDNSARNIWSITIKASKDFVKQSDAKLMNDLKMVMKVTETLNFWGYSGKIERLSEISQLIPIWAKGRLEFMEKRRLFMIQDFEKSLTWLRAKINFIFYWNSNSAYLVPKTKSQIKDEIKRNIQNVSDEDANRLLSLPVSSLAIDDISQLNKEIDDLQNKVKELKSTTAANMLISDINKII